MAIHKLPPFAWQGRDRSFSTAGENSRVSTLTEDTVRAIKAYVRSEEHTSDAATAEAFGLTRATVANIRTGRRWGHVKLDPPSGEDLASDGGS